MIVVLCIHTHTQCLGQYGSAIETLVTAISLVSRSKLVDSSETQELLDSLRAKLQFIERESYSSK